MALADIVQKIQEFYKMPPRQRGDIYERELLTWAEMAYMEELVGAYRPSTTPITPPVLPTDIVGPGLPTPPPPTPPIGVPGLPIITPPITPPTTPPSEGVPEITVPTTPTPPTLPPVPTITKPPPLVPPTMPTPPTITVPGAPTPPTMPGVPTLTPPTMPGVPTVPPYERLPEEVALAGDYAEELAKWREAKGYGIPEEVQTQMIQRATDILKARETESIRVMRNNMETRQITNSGFVFANEQTIKSNTTVEIANNIRDIQISSALIKMASFEKAMGATAQFIGYLSDESAKAYAPKMAQVGLEAQYGMAGYEMAGRYGLAQAGLEAQYGLAKYGTETQFKMAGFSAEVAAVMAQAQIDAQYDLTAVEIAARYDLTEYQAQNVVNMAQSQLEAQYGLAGYGTEAQYGLAGFQAQIQANMAQFQANMVKFQADTLEKMAKWQHEMDLIKLEINQAYQLDKIDIANQWLQKLQDDQQKHELEMAEMGMEANEQVAATTGIWGFLGTLFGWLFGGF